MPSKKVEFTLTQLPRSVSQWIGVLLMVLTLIVVLGWLAGIPLSTPNGPPMRFNTALCLGMSGLALWLSNKPTVWTARIGALVAGIALLTLSQDFTGVELGIDQLFLPHGAKNGELTPDRMSVNTAICLILTGLTLLSLGRPQCSKWQPLLECAFGALVFAIGAASAFGYLSGLEAAYGLGMAIHSAVALALTGFALVGLAVSHFYVEQKTLPRWLPLPAIIVQIVATVVIAQSLSRKETKELDADRAERVAHAAHLIEQQLAFRQQSIAALVRCDDARWDVEATAYFQAFADCRAIARLRADGTPSWFRAHDSVATKPKLAEVWQRLGSPDKTPPASAISVADSTWLVTARRAANDVAEWLLVELDTRGLVLTAIPANWLEDVELRIRDGEHTVLVSGAQHSKSIRSSEATMAGVGPHWQISLSQPWGFFSGLRGPLPWAIIARSLLVALTLTVTIHLAQRSVQHSIDAELVAAELRRTQTRFRAIFDQTFQFIGLLDVQGTVLEANRTALQFAEIPEEAVLGKPFWETPWWSHSPTIQATLRDAIQRAAAGEVIRFETTHPSPSGEIITVDFSLKPFRDEFGHVTLLIPEGRDITALKHAQQRATQIIEQAPSGLLLVDQNATILLANATLERLFGYEREELIGKPVTLLVPAGFNERTADLSGSNGIVYGKHRGGRLIPIEFGICSVMMEDGPALLGSAVDITARLAAEDLQRQSEQRLELAIRGSSDGIWDWNLTTGTAYYSPRYKQLLGYADDEFPNNRAAFHDHLHPDDAANVLQAIEANLERGEPFSASFRMRTKGGEFRWFRSRGDAVRGADGQAQRMAGSLSDVTDAVLAEHELTRRARFDNLTGLPNRLLLLDRLQVIMNRARETSQPRYAVMFLDFDRFKQVNDSLGHDVGDALLQEISARLVSSIRTVDSVSRFARGNTAGRIGGDEFVVLLDDLQAPEDALAIGERLLDAFSQVYQLGEHEVYSTASIGIVIGDLRYDLADDVLRDADVAMYEAKRAGRARFVVFDEAMRQQADRRLRLEFDLRTAVEDDGLALEFEPMLSLVTGELLGVEAHIRWQHPTEGEIAFQEFNALAEESDLIQTIGKWAIHATCRTMSEWLEQLGSHAPRVISLNVSHKQFSKRDFAQVVDEALAAAKLPAERLQLELPEAVLTGSVDDALLTMQRLRDRGVRLALDNFGAGGGSFSLLHRLPLQMIKVDHSLLTEIESSKHAAALFHALAVLVRNLGITLAATSVQRQGQWLALQELGCVAAQGRFVSPRQDANHMAEYLSRRQVGTIQGQGAMIFAERMAEMMSLEPTEYLSP
jgi:diguanylate cyclase (GGDEF)-like protein/PAS domain S-box-containing protein